MAAAHPQPGQSRPGCCFACSRRAGIRHAPGARRTAAFWLFSPRHTVARLRSAQKKQVTPVSWCNLLIFFGAPERNRTPDQELRRLLLYPSELRAHAAHAKAGRNHRPVMPPWRAPVLPPCPLSAWKHRHGKTPAEHAAVLSASGREKPHRSAFRAQSRKKSARQFALRSEYVQPADFPDLSGPALFWPRWPSHPAPGQDPRRAQRWPPLPRMSGRSPRLTARSAA